MVWEYGVALALGERQTAAVKLPFLLSRNPLSWLLTEDFDGVGYHVSMLDLGAQVCYGTLVGNASRQACSWASVGEVPC